MYICTHNEFILKNIYFFSDKKGIDLKFGPIVGYIFKSKGEFKIPTLLNLYKLLLLVIGEKEVEMAEAKMLKLWVRFNLGAEVRDNAVRMDIRTRRVRKILNMVVFW